MGVNVMTAETPVFAAVLQEVGEDPRGYYVRTFAELRKLAERRPVEPRHAAVEEIDEPSRTG